MNASMGDYSSFEGQISLLKPATLVKLSHILNPTKVLLTDDGHLRYFSFLKTTFYNSNAEKVSSRFGGIGEDLLNYLAVMPFQFKTWKLQPIHL